MNIILGIIVVTMLIFTWALLSIVRVVKRVALSVQELSDGAKKAAGVQDAHDSAINGTAMRIREIEKHLGLMWYQIGDKSGYKAVLGGAERTAPSVLLRLADVELKVLALITKSRMTEAEMESMIANSWKSDPVKMELRPDHINFTPPKPKKGRKS